MTYDCIHTRVTSCASSAHACLLAFYYVEEVLLLALIYMYLLLLCTFSFLYPVFNPFNRSIKPMSGHLVESSMIDPRQLDPTLGARWRRDKRRNITMAIRRPIMVHFDGFHLATANGLPQIGCERLLETRLLVVEEVG